MKVISKEQFVRGYTPTTDGKECTPPKIELMTGDKCLINGNKYAISINGDDMVVLTKEG